MERGKGEVCVGNLAGTVHDPSLEWPGHDEVPAFEAASSLPPQTSTLRLIVESSTILSSNKRIAILDGHAEIQLGRDAPSAGTDTPRLRLKELAVSKLHATIFWDKDREEWAIVDMGSVHGTFIASEGAPGCTSSASVIVSARLSAPRVASIPRTLRHLDRLRCGGTTFVVHIHASGLPCIQCSALSTTNADEIPLYQTGASSESPSRSTEKRKRDGLNSGETNWSKGSGRKDVKTALTTLKRDLLRRQEMPTAPAGKHPSVYVDRSARRRALHSHSAADAPGRRSLPADTPDWVVLYPPPPVTPPLHPAPATPISEMTAGYKLLAKQGWKPGSALGLPDGTGTGVRLLEPITPAALPARAGLGIVPRVADVDLRRDESRVKRHWREAQWM